MRLLLLFLFASLQAKPLNQPETLWEDPWERPQPKQAPKNSIPGKLIRFHQRVISPVQGPRSHFYPTSSQYTLLAMREHGFLRGYFMGCSRLTRENRDPWVYRRSEFHGWTRKEDMPGHPPSLSPWSRK